MGNRWGNNGNSDRPYFLRLQNHCRCWLHYEINRLLLLGRKAVTNLDSILKDREYLVKAMVFPVVMYGCESLTIKKAECQRIDALEHQVLEKTLENPLDCKEIQPVNCKRNQSWIFIERTDAEAETPILWPSDAKNWLIGKDPSAGKDWRQEKKGTMENKMIGWHHQLDGLESEQAPEVGDGQGSLVFCSPLSLKELDTTKQLNWTEPNVQT